MMTNRFTAVTELDGPRPLSPSRPNNRFPYPTPHINIVSATSIALIAA
jgi:hypothetical protein